MMTVQSSSLAGMASAPLFAQNITRCHLPDVDGEVDPTLYRPDEDFACEECHLPSDEAFLVLCDGCGLGWHIWCLNPNLPDVPEGCWLCDNCLAAGVTVQDVERRQQISWANLEREAEHAQYRRKHFPNAVQAARDASNASMHGRIVCRRTTVSRSARPTMLWGIIHYRGNTDSRRPYHVVYQDGSEEICGNGVISKRSGWLTPPSTMLPPGITITAPADLTAALAMTAGTLTGCLSLDTPAGAAAALQNLLLGVHSTGYINRLSAAYVNARTTPTTQLSSSTSSSDVHSLLQVLNIPSTAVCLDPFAGSGTIVDMLRIAGCKALGNDINPEWKWQLQHDAFNPSIYSDLGVGVVQQHEHSARAEVAAGVVNGGDELLSCLWLWHLFARAVSHQLQQLAVAPAEAFAAFVDAVSVSLRGIGRKTTVSQHVQQHVIIPGLKV
jgi:hypothetical protein